MKWYKFDKKVRQEMSDHQSEVDIDALWGSMESDVDAINAAKRKKRRGFLWLFFIGILFVGSGLGYWLLSEKEGQSTIVTVAEENNTRLDIDENSAAINQQETVNKELILAKKNLDSLKEAKTNLNNKNQISTQQSIIKSKVNTIQNQVILPEKAKADQVFNLDKNNILGNQNQFIKGDFKKEKEEGFLITRIENSPNLTNENNLPEDKSKEVITAEKVQINNDKNSIDYLKNNRLSELDINQKTLEITALRRTIRKDTKELLKEQKEQKENRKRNFFLSASLQGSLSFTDRSLSSKDSIETNLVQLRQISEKTLETTQVGLLFHVRHKSGIELSSGINYTQINERFEYNTSVSSVDSVQGIQFYYVNVNNDTIANMGSVPVTTTTNFNKRHFNKYRMIDIPILLGYRKQIRKFSIGAQAGVYINLQMDASGEFLNSEDVIVNFGNDGFFKPSVGLSYYFGAMADFQMNDNVSIYLSPFMRVFPKDFAADNYGLEQKYNLYGGTVGIRYSFD